MKRNLSVLLSLVVLASMLLAACGAPATPSAADIKTAIALTEAITKGTGTPVELPTALTPATALPSPTITPVTFDELEKLGLDTKAFTNLSTATNPHVEGTYKTVNGPMYRLLLMKRDGGYAFWVGDPNLVVTIKDGILYNAVDFGNNVDITKLMAELHALESDAPVYITTMYLSNTGENDWIEVGIDYGEAGKPEGTNFTQNYTLLKKGEEFTFNGIAVETITCKGGDKTVYQFAQYETFTSPCDMKTRDSFTVAYVDGEDEYAKDFSESDSAFRYALSTSQAFAPEGKVQRFVTDLVGGEYADWEPMSTFALPVATATVTATPTNAPTATSTPHPDVVLPVTAYPTADGHLESTASCTYNDGAVTMTATITGTSEEGVCGDNTKLSSGTSIDFGGQLSVALSYEADAHTMTYEIRGDKAETCVMLHGSDFTEFKNENVGVIGIGLDEDIKTRVTCATKLGYVFDVVAE